MDLDARLLDRCHINKNDEGDRFVGIKADSEMAVALRKHYKTYDLCQVNGKNKKCYAKGSPIAWHFFVFKISNMSFSVFQRNAQPSPKVMISGVWGHVTNKHLAGIPGTEILLNTQSYVRLHCLPFVS